LKPYDDLTNRLAFVQELPGSTSDEELKVRFDQLEPDLFFRDHTMSHAGRYLLFRVTGPTKPIRLVLDVTASLNSDGKNRVPPARAVGTAVASFHALGNGSARLISDPIFPVTIRHAAFVGIDMGDAKVRFTTKRTGLMLLFGRSVPIDSRSIVGFVRDVSAIAANEQPSEHAPTSVSRFPVDLESKDLFYSGIYEDGWFGKDVRIRLDAAKGNPRLDVRFEVPLISDANFSSSVDISVDGTRLGTWPCPLGASEVSAPTSLSAGIHDIELHFSDVQRLPGLDRRPVGAKVQAIGLD
jgi:hypothetical protein